MFKYKNIELHKHLHSGFRIEVEGKIIYIDPFKLIEGKPAADIIFISHEHFDHCHAESIELILKDSTIVVGNAKVKKKLPDVNILNFVETAPGKTGEAGGITFTANPAYNVNKFREEGKLFHPKENNGIGFILNINGTKIYHMGDTDYVETEMKAEGVDVLLIPVSGTYVMTVDEALVATASIKPVIAIPMHYDSGIIGSKEDALNFQKRADCKVEILDAEL